MKDFDGDYRFFQMVRLTGQRFLDHETENLAQAAGCGKRGTRRNPLEGVPDVLN
jgi:hypothetical protein